MGLKYSNHLVSKTGMIAWYRFKTGVDAGHIIGDESGNGRTLVGTSGALSPVLTVYNNEHYGWYFDGTDDPLVYNGASVTPKHAFVVAASERASFTANEGLFSGPTTGDLLTTNSSGTNWFDFSATYPDMAYRKNNVLFANASQTAPMGSVPAVIELQSATGFALDGIQLGQQKAFVARRWKGIFLEAIFFDRVLTDGERMRIYQYFAKMYHIWEQQTSSGPYVFPFNPDWGLNDARRKRVLGDRAEDQTTINYRTKQAMKRYPELSFAKRLPDEIEAAEDFYNDHYPGTNFVYRDRTIYPASEITVRYPIEAEMEVVPAGPSNFNYKFAFEEV